MKRTQKGSIAMSVVCVVLAVTVTATSGMSHTPLFTFRMEQVSSEMGFLPTTASNFTYTAEKGYTVLCGPGESCGAALYSTLYWTCYMSTCDSYDQTCNTCEYTGCQYTCDTCVGTSCGSTCYVTCDHTYCTCKPPPCPMIVDPHE